ncbi:50S ribosomal protein L10 [Pyrofollis japonicus]|uniref:50S ribosomal protein L10 n=1 Tax=Pyrofollis japonicus TaxID=3060460 RepID=UPI00295C2A75|nr:50S ribosomal protein L10 [Pyrofollis japonicus]BEP18079.1 50S ribosomal protein L10 [Pyrofollis japonicus]
MAYVTTRAKKIPEWKIKEVEELTELAKTHKVLLIVDLMKTPTAQLQRIRRKIERKLGDAVVMRVAKNTLMKIALERAGIDTKKLEEYLTGVNMFIFTNMNPFEVAMTIDRVYATAPAKPGDVAPTEIVLPAGNTGFKPGPIMSVFGKLKVPIRVQGGTIWIAKDTKVAKPGDTISPELASLLQKLGIEPIIVKLKIKAAYDSGVVIPGDQLILDLEAYRNDVMRAHLNALWLGVEIAYPEPQVLEIAIPLAVRRALAVAAEAGYITPDNAEYVLRLAVSRALAVVAALGDTAKELGIEVQVAAPAAPAKPAEEKKEEEEEKKEEEKKEEVSEEQLAAGLESLFGF